MNCHISKLTETELYMSCQDTVRNILYLGGWYMHTICPM